MDKFYVVAVKAEDGRVILCGEGRASKYNEAETYAKRMASENPNKKYWVLGAEKVAECAGLTFERVG